MGGSKIADNKGEVMSTENPTDAELADLYWAGALAGDAEGVIGHTNGRRAVFNAGMAAATTTPAVDLSWLEPADYYEYKPHKALGDLLNVIAALSAPEGGEPNE